MGRRVSILALVAASLAPLLLCLAAARAGAATPPVLPAPASPPTPTRIVKAPGRLVPIPAAIPHEAGDMVDNRIVPDLRWINQRWPIYVTDGYSGPLPNGEHVGCDECHTRGSDHYNGLAVDLVPAEPSSTCDSHWAAITALALWAEPVQNQPLPPFRWVGYEGDAGHGCGNHLHLSWNHAPAPRFTLAEWVEVFPTGPLAPAPRRQKKQPPKQPAGPAGGVDQQLTGGLSPHGSSPSSGGGIRD
ncbi:MAG: hypothetical protein JST31_09000 [Actinobacteria bacterium]|nr:hypothetical protein [Actinomycetota bacterium]